MTLTKIDDRGLKTPIDLLDNEKIRLGTDVDLQLYSDNSNAVITAAGSGDLQLTSTNDDVIIQASDNIFINPQGGENGLKVYGDGGVKLYYDGSTDPKFETTSGGATVSGSLLLGGATTSQGSTNADDLQIGATDQSNQTGITLGSASASGIRFADAANDSAGYITMNHGTDAMTIKSNSGGIVLNVSGEVATVNSTGLKLAATKGINFSAYATSASGSGSPDPSSNLLDDYEEGTWTPQLIANTGGTGINGVGYYTKIGNVVYAAFRFSNMTTTGLTQNANIQLHGLPFASDTNVANQQTSNLFMYNVTFDTDEQNVFYLPGGSSYLGGYRVRSGNAWVAWSTNDWRANNLYLGSSITYIAA